MAYVNCPKCEYAFDPLERYCPRCDSEYKVKETYKGAGPVSGLPYAQKPSKSSRPESIDVPKFESTVKRHNYGPQPNEMPSPRNKINVDTKPIEYKKSNGGKILAMLVIVIILLVVYYVFVK